MTSVFNTLRRGRKTPSYEQAETFLSGIVMVSNNQKKSTAKYVEVKFNVSENRTLLMIFNNMRERKRKPDIAVDLTRSRIIINQDSPHSIACIVREDRIYTLELSPEKEDLERVAAQWRSVFKVAENPQMMFSVITMTGDSRGSIILVTIPPYDPVKFKYLHGTLKDQEIIVDQISRVQKFHQHEVWLETHTGETFHFISKRQTALVTKLESRCQDFPTAQLIPTKSSNNNDSFYASKLGYTPAFNSEREVKPTTDYISRPGKMLPEPVCQPQKHVSKPDKPLINYQSRLPPTPGPPPTDDYLSMDQRHLSEGEYLSMDQRPPPLTEDDYLLMDRASHIGPTDTDNLPMGRQFDDPLISDYLAMDDVQQLKYNGVEIIKVGTLDITDEDQEEPEDTYWDPTIGNIQPSKPPLPPREVSASPPPPPPPDHSDKDLNAHEREFMSHAEVIRSRNSRMSEKHRRGGREHIVLDRQQRKKSEQYPPNFYSIPIKVPNTDSNFPSILDAYPVTPPVIPCRKDVRLHQQPSQGRNNNKPRPKSYVDKSNNLTKPTSEVIPTRAPLSPKLPSRSRRSWTPSTQELNKITDFQHEHRGYENSNMTVRSGSRQVAPPRPPKH